MDTTSSLLLKAARTVFALKGYEGATIKDIVDRAGVNISLVSYHFDGKEGLYRACLESYGRERLAASDRILKPAHSSEEFRVRLEHYADEFILWNMENPEVCAILHRECASQLSFTRDIFRSTFIKSFEMLADFFESARKSGVLQSKCDSFATAALFFGGLVHAVRSQAISQEVFGFSLSDPAYRARLIKTAVHNLLYGILPHASR